MHLRYGVVTWTQTLRMILAGLLAVALAGFVTGCGFLGLGGDDDTEVEAPAAPSGLAATSNDGEITLNWNAVDAADGYNVYRGTSSGVEASGEPLASGVEGTSYPDTDAENGTTYYYRVTAVKTKDGAEAESEGSGEVAKTPFASPPDERPSN